MKNYFYKFLIVGTLLAILVIIFCQTIIIRDDNLADREADCRVAGNLFFKDTKERDHNYDYIYYKTHYSNKLETCLVSYLVFEKNVTWINDDTHYQNYKVSDIYNGGKGIISYSRDRLLLSSHNSLYMLVDGEKKLSFDSDEKYLEYFNKREEELFSE